MRSQLMVANTLSQSSKAHWDNEISADGLDSRNTARSTRFSSTVYCRECGATVLECEGPGFELSS